MSTRVAPCAAIQAASVVSFQRATNPPVGSARGLRHMLCAVEFTQATAAGSYIARYARLISSYSSKPAWLSGLCRPRGFIDHLDPMPRHDPPVLVLDPDRLEPGLDGWSHTIDEVPHDLRRDTIDPIFTVLVGDQELLAGLGFDLLAPIALPVEAVRLDFTPGSVTVCHHVDLAVDPATQGRLQVDEPAYRIDIIELRGQPDLAEQAANYGLVTGPDCRIGRLFGNPFAGRSLSLEVIRAQFDQRRPGPLDRRGPYRRARLGQMRHAVQQRSEFRLGYGKSGDEILQLTDDKALGCGEIRIQLGGQQMFVAIDTGQPVDHIGARSCGACANLVCPLHGVVRGGGAGRSPGLRCPHVGIGLLPGQPLDIGGRCAPFG